MTSEQQRIDYLDSIEVRTDALEVGGGALQIVGPGESLQEAVDLAPDNSVVWVTDAYDTRNDSLPITIDHPVHVRGSGVVDGLPEGSAPPTVYIESPTNAPPSVSWKGVDVNGGNPGIQIQDTAFTVVGDLTISNAGGAGIEIESSSYSPYSCRVRNVYIESSGGSGVYDNSGVAHDLVLDSVLVDGANNYGVSLDSYAQHIYGGAYQQCAGAGVQITPNATMTTGHGFYTENNSQSTGNYEIHDEGVGTVLDGVYGNGQGNIGEIIWSDSASYASYSNFVGYNYTNGVLYVSGADHVDLHRSSHTGTDPTVAAADGTTLDDGVLEPTDLSVVTGGYVGARGIDDGTNVSTSPMLCIWTGSAWQPADGSSSF